jgi:hypothetical protein
MKRSGNVAARGQIAAGVAAVPSHRQFLGGYDRWY